MNINIEDSLWLNGSGQNSTSEPPPPPPPPTENSSTTIYIDESFDITKARQNGEK